MTDTHEQRLALLRGAARDALRLAVALEEIAASIAREPLVSQADKAQAVDYLHDEIGALSALASHLEAGSLAGDAGPS